MRFLKAKVEKPVSYISCGHFISEGEWIHSKRVIDSFEIIIGLKGTAYIQQDEERFVVQPGNVLLLLPGHVHHGYNVSRQPTSFYWLHFNIREQYSILEHKDVLMEISPLKSQPYFNKLSESILIPSFSSPPDIEKVMIQFRQLLHVSSSRYYTPYAADYQLTLLLIELSQQTIQNAVQSIGSLDICNAKFLSILEWIRINLQRDISVNEIAEKFGFNKDYLSRIFRKYLGVSTIKYINGMKVLKAKELLCRSDASIKEIAYSLGFSDEKYFMKLFKEYENLTPSEYRNAYYNTHLNNK